MLAAATVSSGITLACGTMLKELFREALMTRKSFLPLALALLGVMLPACGVAQSDSAEPSLGDLARQFRKGKPALPSTP